MWGRRELQMLRRASTYVAKKRKGERI